MPAGCLLLSIEDKSKGGIGEASLRSKSRGYLHFVSFSAGNFDVLTYKDVHLRCCVWHILNNYQLGREGQVMHGLNDILEETGIYGNNLGTRHFEVMNEFETCRKRIYTTTTINH